MRTRHPRSNKQIAIQDVPEYLQYAICDASWSTGTWYNKVGRTYAPKAEYDRQAVGISRTSRTYMVFLVFVLVTFLRVLYNNIDQEVNQRSKLHTYSAEVPVLHTPVEVAEVRFSMTCRFVDGQGKRGVNVHAAGDHVGRFP